MLKVLIAQQTVQQSADHTAAWLAFGGALLVALVAAGTAQWRQRVELRHAREQADLAELRELLDECAKQIFEASDALVKLTSQVMFSAESGPPLLADEAVELFGETRQVKDLPAGELRTYHDRYSVASHPLHGFYQRVTLRLGTAHPVAQALRAVLRDSPNTYAMYDLLSATERISAERHRALTELTSPIGAAQRQFLAAAHAVVGPRLA